MPRKIQREINSPDSMLEIGLEAVFSRLLLLKKKKYCARLADSSSLQIELKGVEAVRGDYCPLARETAGNIIKCILDSKEDCAAAVRQQLHMLLLAAKNGRIPTEKFFITKMLSKSLDDYGNASGLLHVAVGQRLRRKGIFVGVGTAVSYLVCRDKEGQTIALHSSELETAEAAVDVSWYLAQQVCPVLVRICMYVPGLQPGEIQHALGLEYQAQTVCLKRKHSVLHCPACQGNIEDSAGLCCADCKKPAALSVLCSQLENTLRCEIEAFYNAGSDSRDTNASAALYRKLCQYQNAIAETAPGITALSDIAAFYVGQSAYPWISLSELFQLCS